MAAFLAALLVPYYIGQLVAIFVYPWRAGLNVMAYMGAFAHEPSRRNGIPWVLKTFVKILAWPIVFALWIRDGRPESPVLYGPEAARRLGHPGTHLPGFLTVWKAERPATRPVRTRYQPAVAQTPTRQRLADDLTLIADFGRHQFLGWEAAGEPGGFLDWYGRTARWHQPLLAGPPAMDRAIAQLNDLATTHGGWIAIGAWKLMLEFCPGTDVAVQRGGPALDACVRGYEAFGVTNLAIHLPSCEVPAYVRAFGHAPPNDGFFGPPVFTTPDGPQKADYLRAAAQAAAARRPVRVSFRPEVAPALLPKVGTRPLWDYARLVLLGPLLVPKELRDEKTVLADVIAACDGVDHRLVLAWLRQTLENDPNAMWAAVGASRFCEEYLHPRLTASPSHVVLLDIGLRHLHRSGLLAGNIAPECLSPAETERLQALRRH